MKGDELNISKPLTRNRNKYLGTKFIDFKVAKLLYK